MRAVPILLAFALTGCAGEENSFVVQDPNHLVQDATLRLCDSEHSLQRRGDLLTTKIRIACEGHGEIRLTYRDGTQRECPIGYVTSDAKQTWQFRAERASCELLR